MGSTYEASCQGLATTLQRRINELPQFSERRCIYRVPKLLRETNKKAYTPYLVSIGPLHHKDDRFLPMEAHKLKYLRSFLEASKTNVDLNSYLTTVKGMEAKIRECYADPIDLSSDDFVQMVVIDGAFIIELFRRHVPRDPSYKLEDDYVYGRPNILAEVLRDVELEENQLPFFVLKSLYWTGFKPNANGSTYRYFTDIVCEVLQVNKDKIDVDPETKEASCLHLLDLLRCHYKPTKTMPITSEAYHVAIDHTGRKTSVCPTASNLFKVGVEFRAVSSHDSSDLLDIHFDPNKGVLTIPKLSVMDRTDHLIRNIIAFERCHCKPKETYMTDYQSFMNWLIITTEDVRLLVRNGIIENWLGSYDQVSDVFNFLGQNVNLSMEHYNYRGITQLLVAHCNKKWNRNRATLMHRYFGQPWTAISVIYAAVLLVLTVMQVVTGIMAIPGVGPTG